MCEFPSFLVQRNSKVIFDPNIVSHTTLADKYKVQEDQCIKGDLSSDIWTLAHYPKTVTERQRHMLFFTKEVERTVCDMPNSAFNAAQEFVKKTFYTKKGLRKIIEAGWKTRKTKGYRSNKNGIVRLLYTTIGYLRPTYVKGKKKGMAKRATLDGLLEFLKKAKFKEPIFEVREE